MMKVKGTGLVVLPVYVRQKFGENGFNIWINSLDSDIKDIYKNDINVSEWYPMTRSYTEPTLKIIDLFYDGDEQAAFEIGKFSAQYSLRGIYKFFLTMGTPRFLLKKAIPIMETYFDPVSIKVVEPYKGKVVVDITEFYEMHHIIELRITGWIEEAVRICGGKNVSTELTKSCVKGDDYSQFVLLWE